LPYYGQPSEAEALYIYRSQAKAGTTSFFAYATVHVIRAHRRVTLAIHAVRWEETAVAIITRLLAAINPLTVKVERLYLDRGCISTYGIMSFQSTDPLTVTLTPRLFGVEFCLAQHQPKSNLLSVNQH
jgi:putative transposase